MTPTKLHWRTTEVAALRQHYPAGGVRAAAGALPGRTDRAIYAQAHLHGLRAPEIERRGPRLRHKTNEAIDQAIRAAMPGCTARGSVAALADDLGRPSWWVSKRAAHLGLVVPRTRQPEWSKAEDLILMELEGKALSTIRRALAGIGSARTETAIAVRSKRLHISRIDPDVLNALGLAKALGVDGKTVTRWIATEGLPATREGSDRDQWRINMKRLRAWFATHAQLIDLRKVDRFWFIEITCGAAA